MSASMPTTQPFRVSGKLARVEGNNLVINQPQNRGLTKEVIVTTDDNAEFHVDYGPGKLTDLKPGMNITAQLFPAWRTRPAKLMVSASSSGQMGTVVRVEGRTLVLMIFQREGGPKEVTIDTDEKTKVLNLEPGKVGTVEDLKAGMRVDVWPVKGMAEKISIIHTRNVPSPASGPTSLPVDAF